PSPRPLPPTVSSTCGGRRPASTCGSRCGWTRRGAWTRCRPAAAARRADSGRASAGGPGGWDRSARAGRAAGRRTGRRCGPGRRGRGGGVRAWRGGSRRAPAPPGTRRTDETWSHWQGDGTVHVTWWIRSWPARGIPMQVLAEVAAGVPASAVTVSLTLHPVQTEGVRFRGFVRLSATSPATAAVAARVLERAAGAAGFGLYRLDGEQALGVLATLPLGGGGL